MCRCAFKNSFSEPIGAVQTHLTTICHIALHSMKIGKNISDYLSNKIRLLTHVSNYLATSIPELCKSFHGVTLEE